jgi:hypothetical protein
VRAMAIFALGLISGCSMLDQIQLNGPERLDPNKVYLGSSRVTNLRAAETGRYACVNAVLVCVQRGTAFDCSCP